MPKNKSRAGFKPAKNYVPRDSSGEGRRAPGSRSPGHRGYRPTEEAPKRRWTPGDREARDRREGAGGRPSRGDDRAPRRFERDDRAPRRDDREERAPRRDDRDDRAPRRFDRDDRTPRRDDRAPRRFDRDDRTPRRDDRAPRHDDRAPRRFERDDRAPRREDRDDRAPRRFERDDRAPRRFERDDRAPRRDDRDDRAPRRFGNDDRAPRRDDRDDRAPRRFGNDDRPPRRDDRDDRAPRRLERDDRAPRRADREPTVPRGGTDDVVLERLVASATQAEDVAGLSFGDLGISSPIVRALGELGAAHAFPIQAATIPSVLAGRDVLGRGRTGSGKTIAFAAPLIERLRSDAGRKRVYGRAPRALILAPTRELALQIDRTVQPLARSAGLFTTQVYGGVPQARQVGALRRGVDIVIGTPGRIEDLVEQGHLDLSSVAYTVVDEADHMCDLGFLEPVQRILRGTAAQGQRLLFSATLDTAVGALVEEFLVTPAVHEVAGEDQASSMIEHRVLVIDHRKKAEIIGELADREGKTLVFVRTRAFAEMLADHLDDAGIPAVSLHGDLPQARRTRNLEKLTSGRIRVLVATDVAARGIHVDDIDLIVQADAPDEYKTYLHRAGRTARAGSSGRVVTLITRQRRRRMSELLDRAEITAVFEDAAPGDATVAELARTGQD